MDDRELLELAAKVAGYQLSKRIYEDCDGVQKIQEYIRFDKNGSKGDWNPLKYSGDALELAVKLELTISHHRATHVCESESGAYLADEVDTEGDGLAATRRAIVRAAAEIGRAM